VIAEINFDGLIGPSHNYAALSLGNLASAAHGGAASHPRAAALQGLAKMRVLMALGLPQGVLLPLDRPASGWLRGLGFAGDDDRVAAAAYAADPRLFAQAFSASAMWAANAATVSPAPDTADARCHLSVANLATMPHRSHEAVGTLAQLRIAFADPAFVIHPALPAAFGDEGAANHMRLAAGHDTAGVELFVYGTGGGAFPARQHCAASAAVARRHGVHRALFVEQSPAAIAAGAFHNDVVAVANETVLFAHEQAFADAPAVYTAIRAALPKVVVIEVPADEVSLGEAVASYLFNSQLVTLPAGGMALILPREAQATPRVHAYLQTLVASPGPITAVHYVDVRESMANGGGPACLRLRVVAEPAAIDPRFLLDEPAIDRLERVVEAHWPPTIVPADLGHADLWRQCRTARAAACTALDLGVLI